MAENCQNIHQRVAQDNSDSLEIFIDQRCYRYKGLTFPLDTTAIHFRIWDEKARDTFLIADGPLSARFYIGGEKIPIFPNQIPFS